MTLTWHLTLVWANSIRIAMDRPVLCNTGTIQLDDLTQGVDPVVAEVTATATVYSYETAYAATNGGDCWHPYDTTCAMWAMTVADTCTNNTNYVLYGTYVRVTNLNNNKQVMVRVNDRGPNKLIDLSRGAAEAIGFNFSAGAIPVKIERLS